MNVSILPDIAVVFMLMFARLGTMAMLMPGLGETGVPTRVRLVLALAVTVLFYPAVSGLYPSGLAQRPAMLGLLLAGEIAVGLFVGMSARLIMSATQVAGTVIANQLGLGFAMAVDPTQGQQGVIFGNFLSLLAVTLVFALDLHHLAIAGLSGSFRLFHPGDMLPVGDFARSALATVAEAFRIGVQISAPFLAFGMVFNLGLGMLQKMMPQFQIYFAAMPLSIGLGLLLFGLVLAATMAWYADHLRDGLGRLLGG